MILSEKYQTLDNGGKPFDVEIIHSTTEKYIVKVKSTEDQIYSQTFYVSEVFVGKSYLNSMTEFSAGHGAQFDGNSILIRTGNLQYVFIGHNVFSFKTDSQIISYHSPVGNNCVPYPYAILENGDVYLMIENVILKNNHELQTHMANLMNDPYSYYYDKKIMWKYNNLSSYYANIMNFTIAGDSYDMSYSPTPDIEYDRFLKFKSDDYTEESESDESPAEITMYIGENMNKVNLTKESYTELINNFGNENGFQPLNHTILCKRFW